jgi:hypothetical protein
MITTGEILIVMGVLASLLLFCIYVVLYLVRKEGLSMSQVRTMIEEIERAIAEEDFNLTEWEDGFLESIKRQIANRPLSDKQEDVLTKIWERAKSH